MINYLVIVLNKFPRRDSQVNSQKTTSKNVIHLFVTILPDTRI